jgi:hypothetical protein
MSAGSGAGGRSKGRIQDAWRAAGATSVIAKGELVTCGREQQLQ